MLKKQMRSPVSWIFPVAIVCGLLTSYRGNAYGTIIAICIGLALILVTPFSGTRISAKNPGVLAPITYEFDDFGVSAVYINGETRAAWSLVTGAFETSKYVFVMMQRGSFHLLPKSQMDEQELASLRQILHSKLVTKARRIKRA